MRVEALSTARRDTELRRVLASSLLREDEAREVGEHAEIEQLAPRSRHGVGRVAEDVQQTDVVEAEARHEGVLDEGAALLGQLVALRLGVVTNDRQDLFR